jgi:hypothetical protein
MRRRGCDLLPLLPLLLCLLVINASCMSVQARADDSAPLRPSTTCSLGFDHGSGGGGGTDALDATAFGSLSHPSAAMPSSCQSAMQPQQRTHSSRLHSRLAALPVRTLDAIMRDARQRHRANLAKQLMAQQRAPATTAADAAGSVAGSAADLSSAVVHAAELSSPLPPVPASYDPRSSAAMNASLCASVATVRDQGNCGSDWAASVAAAMSDRVCIQSGAKEQPVISVQDILSCCGWVSSCECCMHHPRRATSTH